MTVHLIMTVPSLPISKFQSTAHRTSAKILNYKISSTTKILYKKMNKHLFQIVFLKLYQTNYLMILAFQDRQPIVSYKKIILKHWIKYKMIGKILDQVRGVLTDIKGSNNQSMHWFLLTITQIRIDKQLMNFKAICQSCKRFIRRGQLVGFEIGGIKGQFQQGLMDRQTLQQFATIILETVEQLIRESRTGCIRNYQVL